MKRLAFVALCLALWVPGLRADGEPGMRLTTAYLRALQAADGGFLPATGDQLTTKSSLRSTTSALRAVKYFHGEPRDPKAAAAFVERCYDKPSGGFADRPGGKPDVPTTAVGIMAVVELKLPTEPYADGVQKYLGEHSKGFEDIRIAAAGMEALGVRGPRADAWLEEVARLRNDDGTYGEGDAKARDTGGATVVVLRLGGEVPHRDNVVKAIKAGQRDDGGWGKAGARGSDLETSYRVMRCFHMLKERPADVGALGTFIAKCHNTDGGYGTAPGQASGVSGTYFAGIILHWLEEK
jgi:hypothetical protein